MTDNSTEQLMPEAKELNINGVKVTVKPPTMAQVLLLAKYSVMLQNIMTIEADELEKGANKLEQIINELIVGYDGNKDLTFLVEAINAIIEDAQGAAKDKKK